MIKRLALGAAMTLAVATASSAQEAPARAPAAATEDLTPYTAPQRLVTLPDGRRMNIFCTGTGAPTVILEGGWTTSTLWWRNIQPELARTTTACSYDRAGYAFSDAGPMPRTASAIADDLAALLKAGAIPGPYVIVAHSLGGLDTRLFVDRNRTSVAGVVLIDPSAPDQDILMAAASPSYGNQWTGFLAMVDACNKGVIAGTLTPDMPASRPCIDPPSKRYPDAINAVHRTEQLRPGYQATAGSEIASVPASSREIASSRRNWGALPLIVLTAANSNADPDLKPEDVAALDKVWWGLHEDAAKLSTIGIHRMVPDSSHFIPKDKPEVVLDAVREVVAQVRASKATR